MLAIDLAVNGKGIAHVTVRNLGPFGEHGFQKNIYAYEYRVEHDDTYRRTQRTIGRLTHRRDDGAFALVRKVMDEISAAADANFTDPVCRRYSDGPCNEKCCRICKGGAGCTALVCSICD